MPYKSDSLYIAHTKHDRRIKLSEDDKKEIRLLSKSGLSQRVLARRFEVSRRLIQFIINPECQEENLKRRKERGGWSVYYSTEKHRQYIKNHRRYKHKLYVDKEL